MLDLNIHLKKTTRPFWENMICTTAVASTTVPWYCHFVLSQIFPTESPVLQSALDHFLFNLLPPCQVTLETTFVAFEFGWGREIELHLPQKHTRVTFRFLCDWLIDWSHVTAMTWFHTFSHPFSSLSPFNPNTLFMSAMLGAVISGPL